MAAFTLPDLLAFAWFIGVWLGGYVYDVTGSYRLVWWLCVALGVFAAVVHWPIVENAVERPAVAA